MRRIFSTAERKRLFLLQCDLLIEDLETSTILIKNKKMRGAYIFLFNAMERLFDCFFISQGIKPSNRKEREEVMHEFFSFLVVNKFRELYYERRGYMYEQPIIISKRELKNLLKFFLKMKEEIEKKLPSGWSFGERINKAIEELVNVIR